MGDLPSGVCEECGHSHPELEYCDYYANTPVDPEWAARHRVRGATHHLKLPEGSSYVAHETTGLEAGYNKNPPRSWEDFKVCKPASLGESKDQQRWDGVAPLNDSRDWFYPDELRRFQSNPCTEIYLGETIVAAAIRIPTPEEWRKEMWCGRRVYPDYLTIAAEPPARHSTLMHPISDKFHIGPSDQGFLTSKGRYVDRVEAKMIVKASNQPHMNTPQMLGDYPELYSEDLW